ncbi:MAG: FkbM family methyltransferase [Eubacterium sp.]|nr:FkbM family methyltransferase [Eubacterium sp.]
MLNIYENDVWEYLAGSKKPIVIYGMGNGAEKIISVLKEYGVEIADIFASDEFVRGHSFLGHKVLKYSEVCEKYDDFNIVLAFATHLPDMLEKIEKMNKEHPVFAPDVPVAGNGIFTRKFFEENREKFEFVYEHLADEESKSAFESIINFKISGKVKYLYSSTEADKNNIYRDILQLNNNETIVDMGAYDGDTIREFTAYTNGEFKHIYALEPDEKNFKKLERNTNGMQGISLYNLGAWSKKDTLTFSKKAGRNSKLSAEGIPVQVSDIDSLIDDKITLLKMDIEGAELRALEGCEQTIKKYSPKLYVCAYHRNEDMFVLPMKIWEYNKNYKIYFRHSPYIPAWESNFYCTL